MSVHCLHIVAQEVGDDQGVSASESVLLCNAQGDKTYALGMIMEVHIWVLKQQEQSLFCLRQYELLAEDEDMIAFMKYSGVYRNTIR